VLKVGLTGNIGCGKSLVAQVFRTLGIPVYHADDESKRFLDDVDIRHELIRHFGYSILANDQMIARRVLASIVFSDPDALRLLTSILHPRVMRDFHEWASLQADVPYIIQEAAIIYEYNLQDQFDRIVHVSCPPEVAIERVIKRDKMSRQEVLRRMKFQMPDEEKRALADFVIENDGTRMVIPQVVGVDGELRIKNEELGMRN